MERNNYGKGRGVIAVIAVLLILALAVGVFAWITKGFKNLPWNPDDDEIVYEKNYAAVQAGTYSTSYGTFVVSSLGVCTANFEVPEAAGLTIMNIPLIEKASASVYSSLLYDVKYDRFTNGNDVNIGFLNYTSGAMPTYMNSENKWMTTGLTLASSGMDYFRIRLDAGVIVKNMTFKMGLFCTQAIPEVYTVADYYDDKSIMFLNEDGSEATYTFIPESGDYEFTPFDAETVEDETEDTYTFIPESGDYEFTPLSKTQ